MMEAPGLSLMKKGFAMLKVGMPDYHVCFGVLTTCFKLAAARRNPFKVQQAGGRVL